MAAYFALVVRKMEYFATETTIARHDSYVNKNIYSFLKLLLISYFANLYKFNQYTCFHSRGATC